VIWRRDRYPHIDPGQAPGGLVIRIRRADGTTVYWDTIVDMDHLGDAAVAERTVAHQAAALANAPCHLEVFDGETGELTAGFYVLQVNA
jgi:hypothetical protein